MDSARLHQLENTLATLEDLVMVFGDDDEYHEFQVRSSVGYEILGGLNDIEELARICGLTEVAKICEEEMSKQQWEAHEMNRFGRKNWKAAPDARGGWYVCAIEDVEILIEKIKEKLDAVD
jgi:hypothetical protein